MEIVPSLGVVFWFSSGDANLNFVGIWFSFSLCLGQYFPLLQEGRSIPFLFPVAP